MSNKSRQEEARNPKRQIDFIVTTSNPKHDTHAKKRARSAAALKSWPERRRKAFEHLATIGYGGSIEKETANPDRELKWTARNETNKQKQVQISSSTGLRITPGLSEVSGHPPIRIMSNESDDPAVGMTNSREGASIQDIGDPLGSFTGLYNKLAAHLPRALLSVLDESSAQIDTLCWCIQCRNARIIAGGSQGVLPAGREQVADGSEEDPRCVLHMSFMPLLHSPSGGRVDPFNCYPVEYHAWYDPILHHMLKVYCPRGWSALQITNEQGFEWEWWMTQSALAEPALFYVRLLFGSGDLRAVLPPKYTYFLHAKAAQAMQEAVQDPKRATSDATIMAVGRIAFYEYVYGSKQACRQIHRPAQKRMVQLRGGMKSLTVPPLMKQLMRWGDRIMAASSDGVRLLEDDEVANFSDKDTVAAVGKWAPDEMPVVRSKINISDLVND